MRAITTPTHKQSCSLPQHAKVSNTSCYTQTLPVPLTKRGFRRCTAPPCSARAELFYHAPQRGSGCRCSGPTSAPRGDARRQLALLCEVRSPAACRAVRHHHRGVVQLLQARGGARGQLHRLCGWPVLCCCGSISGVSAGHPKTPCIPETRALQTLPIFCEVTQGQQES